MLIALLSIYLTNVHWQETYFLHKTQWMLNIPYHVFSCKHYATTDNVLNILHIWSAWPTFLWHILVINLSNLSSSHPISVSLNTCVSGSKAITNSNDENESPWNIPLLVGTEPSSFPSAYTLVFNLFMLYLMRPLIFLINPTILILDMKHQ